MKAIAPSRTRLATSLSSVILSLALGAATAQAAPKDSAPAAQTVQITEKARELFRTGVTLLQDPDGARYEEAYQQFKAAYAESPSWKILGNLGFAAMKLERDGEAIVAFQGYLQHGYNELSKAERAQFQSDLDTLSATAATITILGLPAATRVTDVRSPNQGSDIKNHYEVPADGALVLRVRPGAHRFTAQSGDRPAQTHELEVMIKGSHELKFEAAQPEPAQPQPALTPAPARAAEARSMSTRDRGIFKPAAAYVSLGVGAVGVGLGVLFLAQRSSTLSDSDSKFDACLASQACGPSDQSEMEALDDKAAKAGRLSVLSFGVGAVGLGAGVTLLVLNGRTEATPPAASGVIVQPYASTNELGLWGRF
ncbi:MAG: hypothetical protein ABW217_20430 [Polyangiaceae bacterium]